MLARLEDDLPALVAEEVASLLTVGERLTVGALVDADDVAGLIADVLTRVPPSTAASTFTPAPPGTSSTRSATWSPASTSRR